MNVYFVSPPHYHTRAFDLLHSLVCLGTSGMLGAAVRRAFSGCAASSGPAAHSAPAVVVAAGGARAALSGVMRGVMRGAGAPSHAPSWAPAPLARLAAPPSAADADGPLAPPPRAGRVANALELPSAAGSLVDAVEAMNRNMREPRKSNHGARPCSSVRRRRKYKTRLNPHPYIPARRKKGLDA